MTPHIAQLKQYLLDQKHFQFRREVDWEAILPHWSIDRDNQAAVILKTVLAEEAKNPVFLPNERIVFTRTCANLPERYPDDVMERLRKEAYFHEKGVVFNLSPNYEDVLSAGLDAKRAEAVERRERALAEKDYGAVEFLDAVISGIDAVLQLVDAYAAEAMKQGRIEIVSMLSNIPRKPARNFHEALQFLRILHFTLWCEGAYHNGLGRFDQYMYPYLIADLHKGILTRETALDLLEEFFLTFNRDSDLYVGVQQGDNGQSMMLGGCDREGNDAVNVLTALCLEASCDLKLIDPKINLRVSKNTSMLLLEKAAELTKQGIGFPQYANDDVVIPGLVRLGYSLEDARDYAVAACWEFIIPGIAMDIPNLAAVSFPSVVNTAMRSDAGRASNSFEAFMTAVREELFAQADMLAAAADRVDMLPCPFLSMLCRGRIEKGLDICWGAKYNNFGIHGTGLAPAVDSLESIKRLVFEEKTYTMDQLTAIVDKDFEGEESLLAKVRHEFPKFGNDVDEVDEIAVRLLNDFADSWENRINCRGGIYRAGTGSAMYYLWHADELPATPDGRLAKTPFPANYAPSLDVQIAGPISVIKSFTKPDLSRVINGGPLTIELHDSVFRHEDGIQKAAQLVKLFIDRGGHQLQINTINREQLLDAQANPEQYRQLIVRVWGWSGYFVELDRPYQDQIIRRAEMTL